MMLLAMLAAAFMPPVVAVQPLDPDPSAFLALLQTRAVNTASRIGTAQKMQTAMASTATGDGIDKKSSSDCKKSMLPSLLYVGEGHAGSTSLAELMQMHPELSYGSTKEHEFFFKGPIHSKESVNETVHSVRSIADYEGEFEVDCNVRHTFDAAITNLPIGHNETPAEFVREGKPGLDAIQSVGKLLGQGLKVMVMFRDPVEIILSAGAEEMLVHTLSQPPASRWSSIPSSYHATNAPLSPSILLCPAASLSAWMQVFPREQFLFLKSEDFFANAQHTLDLVFDFAGVSPMTLDPADTLKYANEMKSFAVEKLGRARGTVSMANRRMFHSDPYMNDCKERLEEMTGLHFEWPGS